MKSFNEVWVVESYWSLWETATIIRCSHLLIFSLGNIFCVGIAISKTSFGSLELESLISSVNSHSHVRSEEMCLNICRELKDT